jgi:hypothetical protein
MARTKKGGVLQPLVEEPEPVLRRSSRIRKAVDYSDNKKRAADEAPMMEPSPKKAKKGKKAKKSKTAKAKDFRAETTSPPPPAQQKPKEPKKLPHPGNDYLSGKRKKP